MWMKKILIPKEIIESIGYVFQDALLKDVLLFFFIFMCFKSDHYLLTCSKNFSMN